MLSRRALDLQTRVVKGLQAAPVWAVGALLSVCILV